MNMKAYMNVCMLLVILFGTNTIFAQAVDVPLQVPGDSTYHNISGNNPEKINFEQPADSSQMPVQTRSCVSSFTSQTVSSSVSVMGCNTLTVQNVNVTSTGSLSLSTPGEITINGTFDVLLGGSLNTSSIAPGNSLLSPINIGTHGTAFQFSDTQNSVDFTNEYVGRPSNDIFYMFTLTVPMDVTIKHCGSFGDTYLHLLNEAGSRIAYNDDYTGAGRCDNATQSYLKLYLEEGVYFIVSEGYSSNGLIQTTVIGEVPNLIFNYVYDASGNRIARQLNSAGASRAPGSANNSGPDFSPEKMLEEERNKINEKERSLN